MRALIDGMLEQDAADVALVTAALATAGKTLQDMPKWWVDSHIKRTAPPGHIMQANVLAALNAFKGKACVVTGKEVITEAVWEVYRNQSLANIEIGGKLYNTWDLAAGQCCMCCCSEQRRALCCTRGALLWHLPFVLRTSQQ